MIRQCSIILGCLALGELIVWLTGIKIPSSILGMLILTALLEMKVVKVEWINAICNFLTGNLGLFFVPAGVALMLYFDLLKAELLPIVVASVVSTVIVLVVTGHTYQFIRKHGNSRK